MKKLLGHIAAMVFTAFSLSFIVLIIWAMFKWPVHILLGIISIPVLFIVGLGVLWSLSIISNVYEMIYFQVTGKQLRKRPIIKKPNLKKVNRNKRIDSIIESDETQLMS